MRPPENSLWGRTSPASSRTCPFEADEAFIGHGRNERCFGVLAEARPDGRIRMAVLDAQTERALTRFVRAHAAPGSIVSTDGGKGYNGLQAAGFRHRPVVRPESHDDGATSPTPHADAAISGSKRRLIDMYHGLPRDPQPYLDGYCIRREHRRPGAAFRTILEQIAVVHV